MDKLDNNLQVNGFVQATQFLLASGGTAQLPSSMGHQHAKTLSWSGAQSDATQVIHVVKGATGTIISFCAGSVTPCAGAATCTLDLKKNGTTVLSAVITLNNTHSAYEVVEATLSTTSVVTEDVLTVVVDAIDGGYPAGTIQGLFCELRINEDYES